MKKKKILPALFLILVLIYMLIPLVVSVTYSLFRGWTGMIPRGFTLDVYRELFADKSFLLCLGRTIVICIIPIALTILLVLLAMFVTTVHFPKLEKYVQLICMIPYTIQGVILSVSILALYATNQSVFGNRIVMLIGAYCIIILPHIYTGIKNGIGAINMPVLLEAAQMLGASKLYAFFRVIVPNILPAIVVSALLAVGIIFGDYVLDRNLASSAFPNVQIYLYQAMKSDPMKSSAVFCVIMAVTFLISALVLFLQAKTGNGKKEEK